MQCGEFNIVPCCPSLRFADVLDSLAARALMKEAFDYRYAVWTDASTVIRTVCDHRRRDRESEAG